MAQIDFPPNPFHGQTHRVPEIAASYIYDRSRDSWYFSAIAGGSGGDGSGGGSVLVSELPPSNANNGDLWVESNTYYLHVYDTTIDNGRWIGITNNGGDNTMVHMDDAPPSGNVAAGQMWFDTEVGDLRVLYTDPTSSQWVTITSNGQSLGVTSNIIRMLEGDIERLSEEIEALKGNASNDQFALTLEED